MLYKVFIIKHNRMKLLITESQLEIIVNHIQETTKQKTILIEGWKDIVLGTAMLMGIELSGLNAEIAKKALTDLETIQKINDTIGSSKLEKVAETLEGGGLKDAMSKIQNNAQKIKEKLAGMNLLVEDWGGKYQSQEISGKTGMGIDLLLEKVCLEADMLELTANPKKRAIGTVIEAALDKGRGIVTTVLIQAGTLRVGDAILAGGYSGKVKALHNERGLKVDHADPSRT